MQTVLLADGAFPTQPHLIQRMQQAKQLVCCDGAIKKLMQIGLTPTAIVGDMDSIPADFRQLFSDRLYPSPDQETNDLTKAVEWCIAHNFRDLCILGATGLREDHTIGNMSLLGDYVRKVDSVCILTDYGRLDAFNTQAGDQTGNDWNSCKQDDGSFVARFQTRPGQQVSLFSLDSHSKLTTSGLQYPIVDRSFTSWWQGSLNEALGESFEIRMKSGCVLVYRLD